MNKIVVSGRRKRAVARAKISNGSGKVEINKKPYLLLHQMDKLKIEEPLRIAKEILGNLNFDVSIKAEGGGDKGQIESSRLALARAIIAFTKNKDLEKAYINYDRSLLVADIRRKEPNKPGDSKARRKRQSSKR